MSFRISAIVVVSLIAFWLLNLPTAFAASVRIMNVGDSDVSGYQGYASYRYDLWFLLVDGGFDVDFVGRTPTPISLINEDLYPRYEDFDHHHEARNGRVVSQTASSAASMVEANDPHIVLYLGSQDACDSGFGAPNLVRLHLGAMIDNMRSVNPNLHFLLGQIYPYDGTGCDANLPQVLPELNQAVAEVASSRDAPNSRVVVVDHYSGFNSGTMFPGPPGHANRLGEMFIAGNWFNALQGILPLVEPQGDTISINSGLNDAWFNPATPGQGFFITVFPDIEMMFLAWFTYDTERPAGSVQANLGEPGHRWLTAFGPYADNVASLAVEVTSGGVFNSASPAPGQQADGTITLEFEGCNAATLTYDIVSANVSGEIPIQRIALDNVANCEALAR